MNGFGPTALLVALTAGLSAQTPAPTSSAAGAAQEKPTFKVQVDLVTSDIIVRDEKGNFIPDLKKDEFEVYEDGVKQDITSMTVVTGGRVTNVLAPPPPPPPEGIILPPSRPKTDVSGRIFLFFVDDLHLQFHNTGRVRELFKKISKELVHDGDMFGIVSSGPSSIAIDMTYDKSRLDEAIKKIAGNELKPTDIINGPSGAEGPSEVRYRAHVAFSTVNDLLNNLNSVHQPPQGAHLRQRRLRLQPVPGRAARPDGRQLAVRAERIPRARRTSSRTPTARRAAPIRSRSSRSRARRSRTRIWRASSAS